MSWVRFSNSYKLVAVAVGSHKTQFGGEEKNPTLIFFGLLFQQVILVTSYDFLDILYRGVVPFDFLGWLRKITGGQIGREKKISAMVSFHSCK